MMLKSNGLLFACAVLLAGALSTRVSSHATPSQAVAAATNTQAAATYVGSQSCRRCHTATYDRWSKTRMANVVTDPKAHPEVVLPDFSKPDPLLTFKLDDVAFVYGSKWKQRYFTKRGDDYYPLPAQWDVTNRVWRPYFVQPNTDWWVPHYPADNMQRPTGAALRWLPFRQLRREDQHGHGVERRLREVPRSRKRPHRRSRPSQTSSIPRSSISSAPTTPAFSATRRGSRCTTRSRASTSTGRSGSSRASSSRISGSSRSTSWVKRRSRISRTAPDTRTACRAMTSCRA